MINCDDFHHELRPRARATHKGHYGHVMILGGDIAYHGAVHMAALAAARVGAGLVSIITRPEHAMLLTLLQPEIMSHGVSDTSTLLPLLKKATALVVGPGMGQSAWSEMLYHAAIASDKPMVLDADALHLLATHHTQVKNSILTPHPGEAATLLHTTIDTIEADRFHAARAIAERYLGICVLKGSGVGTLIDSGTAVDMCTEGNPGMASGGMGDILSGVIGGLLAQRFPLELSAKMGVCLHARAGDMAAKNGERGLLATDLLLPLRKLVNPHQIII